MIAVHAMHAIAARLERRTRPMIRHVRTAARALVCRDSDRFGLLRVAMLRAVVGHVGRARPGGATAGIQLHESQRVAWQPAGLRDNAGIAFGPGVLDARSFDDRVDGLERVAGVEDFLRGRNAVSPESWRLRLRRRYRCGYRE